MSSGRFELPRTFVHQHLKLACLPVSPRRHVGEEGGARTHHVRRRRIYSPGPVQPGDLLVLLCCPGARARKLNHTRVRNPWRSRDDSNLQAIRHRTPESKLSDYPGAFSIPPRTHKMVSSGRLELPRLAAPAPEAGVSTDFTTKTNWGERRDLNPQPLVPQTSALTIELRTPHKVWSGAVGLEPTVFGSTNRRVNQLHHCPENNLPLVRPAGFEPATLSPPD